ncbi:MAG: zf-HC2 domain-containing protein [Anaerolineales bacterium]|nr:zf-HC2 domain-containing protein [Anaerolineales bacterium]HEY61628.1 zf-HC2 domain-containing protein [Anaerolineae bacterium]
MDNENKCAYLLDYLSDYVDGSLNESLCEEIERHIVECEDCRIFVDTLKKTIYLYHTKEKGSATVPNDVRKRLYKRLKLEEFLNDSSESKGNM